PAPPPAARPPRWASRPRPRPRRCLPGPCRRPPGAPAPRPARPLPAPPRRSACRPRPQPPKCLAARCRSWPPPGGVLAGDAEPRLQRRDARGERLRLLPRPAGDLHRRVQFLAPDQFEPLDQGLDLAAHGGLDL